MRTLLIDGNNALSVAVHALANSPGDKLKSRAGIPTGGLFVFIRSLRAVIQEYAPDLAIACWDWGHSEWRKSIYPEYKAHRAKAREYDEKKQELYQETLLQIDLAQKMTPSLGLGGLRIHNYEADDAIYILSMQARAKGDEVLILSTDKDMLQLISPMVSVINTVNKELITHKNFYEKKGVPLKDYLAMRAIIGDKSDNISGVKGCAEKTAAKYLAQGPLYDVIKSLGKKPKRTATEQKLVDGKAIIVRNLKLMDLRHCPRPKPSQIEKWPGVFDMREARRWCAELNFDTMLDSASGFFYPFMRIDPNRREK